MTTILVITLEQSKVFRPDILDWLTQPENRAGINHERYWIINSNTNIVNVHNDHEVEKLRALLHLSVVHNYTQIMIKKRV